MEETSKQLVEPLQDEQVHEIDCDIDFEEVEQQPGSSQEIPRKTDKLLKKAIKKAFKAQRLLHQAMEQLTKEQAKVKRAEDKKGKKQRKIQKKQDKKAKSCPRSSSKKSSSH